MNLCCRFLHSGCGCISYASVCAKHLKCLMHDQIQVHIMCTYIGYIYTPILKSMQRVLRYSSGHIPYDKVKTDLKVGHIGSDQKSDLFASTLYHLGWQDAKWKKNLAAANWATVADKYSMLQNRQKNPKCQKISHAWLKLKVTQCALYDRMYIYPTMLKSMQGILRKSRRHIFQITK